LSSNITSSSASRPSTFVSRVGGHHGLRSAREQMEKDRDGIDTSRRASAVDVTTPEATA
jgi:hypothetical protein